MDVVLASALAGLAASFVKGGFVPLAPFLLPKHLVGQVLSLQGLVACATLVVVGPFVDRIGSGKVLRLGICIQLACIAITAWSTSLSGQLLGRLLQGVSFSAIFNPCIAFVMDHFVEPERAAHIGTVLGACMVGKFLGAPVVSFLYFFAEGSPYRQVLAFSPGAILLLLGWAALSRALRRPLLVRENLLEKSEIATAGTCQCLSSILRVYAGVGPQAWLLASMLFCICSSNGALQCAGVLLMHADGLSPAAIGMALVPGTLAGAILSPYAGRLSSTPRRRRYALTGSLLFFAIGLSAVALLPPRAGGAFLATVSMVVSAMAMSLIDAPSISLMGSLAAAKGFGPGEAVTASEMAVTGGSAVGPLVGQFALTHVGYQGLCLGFAVAGGALGAWCCASLREDGDAMSRSAETSRA